MGAECQNCRKWEEDTYWSRFQTVQFFQVLSGRFDQRLAIPKKFAKNLREKLAGSVRLKGPSGAIWNVELTGSGDTLFLKHGWKEFIEAYSLEENDLLIFKYNGDSRFDVSMFDRQSFCEKEASYFVKNCEHGEVVSGVRTKRTLPENYDATESPDDDNEVDVMEKPSDDGAWTPTSGTRSTRGCRTQRYAVQFTSNRRPISEEEKQKAVCLASAAATKGSFTVVMRASHVYRGFYMTIPSEWAKIHLQNKSLDVILRVKEQTWPARFLQRDCGGGLTGGWKDFVLDNFLEEFDVCLFNLSRGEVGATILDVSIFRVVEEVTPPSLVGPPSSSGGKNVRRKAV